MPAAHSDRHQGLQRHSLGETYPWTVAVKGHGDSYRCVPFNCLTSEEGPSFSIPFFGFEAAHRIAENYGRVRLGIATDILG